MGAQEDLPKERPIDWMLNAYIQAHEGRHALDDIKNAHLLAYRDWDKATEQYSVAREHLISHFQFIRVGELDPLSNRIEVIERAAQMADFYAGKIAAQEEAAVKAMKALAKSADDVAWAMEQAGGEFSKERYLQGMEMEEVNDKWLPDIRAAVHGSRLLATNAGKIAGIAKKGDQKQMLAVMTGEAY